ncbi:hypothetical protein ACS0TY_000689 [Phlomoides rotata]
MEAKKMGGHERVRLWQIPVSILPSSGCEDGDRWFSLGPGKPSVGCSSIGDWGTSTHGSIKSSCLLDPGMLDKMVMVQNPAFVPNEVYRKDGSDFVVLSESMKRKLFLKEAGQEEESDVAESSVVPALCELVKARRPDVVFLFETLFVASRIEEIRVSFSNNHIDLLVNNNDLEWRVTDYYGIPNRNLRSHSWALLCTLAAASNLPWLCLGDFNDLLFPEDKMSRVDHPNWLFEGFR